MTENNRLTIEVVSDEQELERISEEWRRLTDRYPETSVFYWYDWLAAAWQWKQRDSKLAVVVVRIDESLVAIWPLMRRRRKVLGFDVRYLDYLAIPDTQECDLLCLPDTEDRVALAIAEWLEGLGNWDILRMHRIPPDSFATQFLAGRLSASAFWLKIRPHDENLLLPLKGKWEEYYARRSRRLKKGNNLVANRLAKNFNNIEVQRSQLSHLDQPERNAVLQDLCDVSENSWKDEATGTTFAADGPREFLEKLISTPDMCEHIVIWRLILDSRCVATEFQLVVNGVVSALRSDFDSRYGDHSPGTYLNKEILQRLFDENLESYRMGPGSNAYKLRWSESAIELSEIFVYSKSVTGRLLFAYLEVLRPFLGRVVSFFETLLQRKRSR